MEKLRQRLHDLERQLEEDRLTAQRTEHKLLEKLEKETRQRLDMEEEVNEKDRALEALVAQQECAAAGLLWVVVTSCQTPLRRAPPLQNRYRKASVAPDTSRDRRFLNLFGPSRCLKILFYCVIIRHVLS